jgi:hypothetical protein
LKKYFYFFLFWHLKKSFTFNKKILTTWFSLVHH